MRFAGWASDGEEVLIEGPASALWRVSAAGGTATAITTPHTVSSPWSFQRVYLSDAACYGLFTQSFTTGSGGSATSSSDDLIVVQQGELTPALLFTGAPEPVPGGRWCNSTEMPSGRHGLFRTTVADGVTVPLYLEPTVSTSPRGAGIQCLAGSCSTVSVGGVWPDFDGDGLADRSVFRPEFGGWFADGQPTAFLGLAGDVPVPGDFDGDGVTG